MKELSLKLKIYGLLIVYILALLMQSWMPLFQSDIFANEKKPTTNIVTILVDKNLYDGDLKDSVDRYATNYIQQKISNSKAVIFPINTETISARDISKMIENIYYDGIEKESSTLQGVVLIGDKIPLPVVNDNGAIFPTIFPYTDFDEPKYYRDPTTQFFIPNKNPKAQAEIRHSMINVGGQSEDYLSFFKKLKQYNQTPTNYIGNKIWYDDFIDQQQSFNKLNVANYINKFIFAEDLAYHRYNPLLIDLRTQQHNKKTTDLTEDLANLSGNAGSYANQVGSVFSGLLAGYKANSEASSSSQVPTVMVDDSLKGFQKSYQDLYGVNSTARMRDNVLSAGRRTVNQIDSHAEKIEHYDQLFTKQLGESRVPFLVEVNKKLEDKIISLVQTEQYPLRVSIPINATIEKHAYTKLRSGESNIAKNNVTNFLNMFGGSKSYYNAGIYEAFYYGKNASTITNIDQTSIFFGTKNPINNDITKLDTLTGSNNTRSIGASFGILSQFIEANRGYVVDLVQSDLKFKQDNNICGNDTASFYNYRDGYLGGNTPLNLTGGINGIELMNKRYDRGGISNRIIANFASLNTEDRFQAGSISNFAGSKRVKKVEPWMIATNLQGGYLQRVAYEDIEYNPWSIFNMRRKVLKKVNTCDISKLDSQPLSAHDIFNATGLYQTGYYKHIQLNNKDLITSAIPCPANPTTGSTCFPIATLPAIGTGEFIQKQELNYKTIDSLSLHTSPNEQQINLFNKTTPDRPIDSTRYLTFKGIGGSQVKFNFPNFYDISVYKTDSKNTENLVLKSTQEIEQTIREYLQNIIVEYNSMLNIQIAQQPVYFNSNIKLFTKLGAIDSLATPSRNYKLIDTNILNNMIDDDTVAIIAQLLYTENSLIPLKKKSNSVAEEINQLNIISNITNKKKNIIEDYITKKTPKTPLSLPGYQAQGYELIAFTSNGDDSITSNEEPEEIRGAQTRIDDYETYVTQLNNKSFGSQEKDALKEACASQYGEPVPLVNLGDMSFPWFDMFACWLKRIGTPKVSFDFKNAQGPVLTDSFFKDFVSDIGGKTEQYTITPHTTTSTTTSEEKKIIESIHITVSPQSYLLDPTTPISIQPQISIERKNSDIGDVVIAILSTGTNCVLINNSNTCRQAYTTTLSSQKESVIYPVQFQTQKAGYADIIIKICKKNGTCAIQNYSMTVVPGPVHTVNIISPYDNILIGSPVPITLNAKDQFNNSIPFSLLPYKITTSTGTLAEGNGTTILSDFREIQKLQGPTGDTNIETNITITQGENTITTKKLYFSPGTVSVSSQDTYVSTSQNKITYTLPKKQSLLYINKAFTNIGLLPKLTLDLKKKGSNTEALAGPIIVQSEKGLFDIYRVSSFANPILANTGLELTNTIIFNGAKEHIILKPKGISGNDNLLFKYPDGHQENMAVDILAATEATQVKIIPQYNTNTELSTNTSIKAILYAYDDWGNTVSTPTLIQSKTFGALSLDGSATKTTLIPAGGSTPLTINTESFGGKGYMVSTINSKSETIPAILKVKVEENIIPKGNINTLYLNIMGTNRGDITTENSSKYNFIPQLFKSSDKLLATTTQLIDPSKLKLHILQISNNGETVGAEKNNRLLVKRNGNIIAQNIVGTTEVMVGTTQEYSRGTQLQEAITTYPIDHTISVQKIRSTGTTNSEKILTLVNTNSTYNPSKLSSLEDSIEPNKNIGWRHRQDHLVQFGQGKSVGESTFTNASEFLINYGDPLITRINNNPTTANTDIDDGPGQIIVKEETRTILKALSIDVNNDGLQDIVTVFSNGDLIRSKQYGGKDIFVEMGPLFKIFGNIKDVFGVNAQGDGFDDIMVQSTDNTLRIYTNESGIFDVDGYPVCINNTTTQGNSVDNIDQWFVKDMDKDGLSDIILNQEGEIKITYGGKTGNGYSYISQLHDSCDINRQTRQKKSIKIVETLATQLSEGNIADSSLLRRQGLTQSTDNTSTVDNTITKDLENQINGLFITGKQDFGAFPAQAITNQASANLMRWSVSPIDYMPSYETASAESIRYITTSQLEQSDQVRVYKKYQDLNGGILRKDDKVKVTVSIAGVKNEPLTYIDRIQGPWTITMNNNGVISGWNNGSLPTSSFYKAIDPQGGFMFVVDNITLGSSNTVEFSYEIAYQGGASTKISISDRNNDEYPDISIYPLDGCAKFLRTYINNKSIIYNKRDYNKTFVDLEKKLSDYNTQMQSNSQSFISNMTNAIQNIATATGPEADTINTILNNVGIEKMSFGNFLNNSLEAGGTSVSLNLGGINTVTNEINNKVRDAMKELCGGSKGGASCNSGLPIPFNMAFLAPGDFNIMGCKPNIPQIDNIFPKDSGFPVFAFPATLTTPVGPLPLPFPFGGFQKGATDSYGYFGFPTAGGTYPSMIRIYLAPTLTKQMGMAICMGPQAVGEKIPSPFNALGGNCIVTKIELPGGSCTNNDGNGQGSLSDQDLLDLAEFGTCTQGKATQSQNGTTANSPFKLVSYTNGSIGNAFPSGTYFGVINFEKSPIVIGEESANEGIVLQGGKEIQPQVQGAKPKGMVACIMGDWLDRQSNYIINNFTNMQIGVYLPDLSQIGQGFENISDNLENNNSNGYTNQFISNFGTQGDGIQSNLDTFSGNLIQDVRNFTINKASLQSLSDDVNNPFTELAKLFEQTPLIRMNTIDVPVSIPMIYAEDITKYEAHLKIWLERNKQIIKDWESIVQGTIGLCGKNYDLIGNSTTPATLEQTPILSKEFFDQLYAKLIKEEQQITAQVKKKDALYKEFEICRTAKRDKNNQACQTIMKSFNIKEKELNNIDKKINGGAKINNQCIDIFFNENGSLNATFQSFFSIITASSSMETNIRANIKTLDQYKRFPLQLYQWIHVVDRYLSEITTSVDNFLGTLTLWLNTNATRFEQYVDAIITISTALQTWQAILDLSVDRQKKCATCTVDNYDAYACSLGSLCGQLKLPILKLPPFKIPNIYIDLSHIDVGMDINLPNFQFTPTSVPLIAIPDLPQPPSILINGDIAAIEFEKIGSLLEKLNIGFRGQIALKIPNIPLLPSPPNLPELPSFIPNISIELPVLPPAPKLPKIAPEIQTAIKAVSFFSELYCIVKGGIGLVGESNVKTKIEQMTQRTYEIPLFDNINLSKDMSYQQDKLQGFDFKIDAYVNFTMNFNTVYTLIKGLADNVNKQTKKITQRESSVQSSVSKLNENAQRLNSGTQQNITLGNPLGFINNDQKISLENEKKDIKNVTQFLVNDSRTPTEKKETIIALQNRVEKASQFIPQTQQIQKLKTNTHNIIATSRTDLAKLSSRIEDYDTFVKDLSHKKQLAYTLYTGKSEFTVPLFTSNTPQTTEHINIMKDYIGLQKTLLSHYKKGLGQVENNANKEVVTKINTDIAYLEQGLNFSEDLYTITGGKSKQRLISLQSSYDAEKNLLYNNQAATCESLSNTTSKNTNLATTATVNNIYPYFGAQAQVGISAAPVTQTTTQSTTNLYDFSAYNNKILIPSTTNTNNKYVNIVSSEYFSNNNKGYEHIDINNDNNKDVVLRDTNNVWIKYGRQDPSHILPITNTTTTKYVTPVWEKPEQRTEDTTDGYLKINTIKLKITSKDRSVKNLRVSSQDYDSFTMNWTSSERQQPVGGYLLEINKIPDLYHLKGHNDVPNNLQSRYVLFVPKGTNHEQGYLSIKNQLNTKSFDALLTGTLLDIVEYNPESQALTYSFTHLERARYYTRIASVMKQGDENKPIYTPSSPRSHHIVAGQQISADTQGPQPDIQLQRVVNNKIIDTGLSPQGFVNTKYNLIIKREDPNGVKNNWIETSNGSIISQSSGDTTILSGLYFDNNIIQNYRIGSRDNNDNITREQLNLTINTPTISIEDIIYENTPTNGVNVIAAITQGMDTGIVKFERKRNNIRSILHNNSSGFNYPLTIDQTNIVGGLYNQHQNISFFAPNGETVATMNKDNGSIQIEPKYSTRIIKKVNFISNTPTILLYDTIDNKNVFSIKPKTKDVKLISNTPYKIINLSGSVYGSFAGGKCITGPDNNCMVITTPNNLVVIPAPYHTSLIGEYTYNNEITTLSIKTNLGQPVGSLSFTAFVQ